MTRCQALAVALAGLAAMVSTTAVADERAVAFVVIGAADGAPAIRESVMSVLPAARYRARWSDRATFDVAELGRLSEARDDAEVWIDARRASAFDVHFARGQASRFATRTVTFETVDVATRETLALVVATTLDGLFDPTQPALTRSEWMKVAAKRERSWVRTFSLTLAERLLAFAPSEWLHGPEAALAISLGGERFEAGGWMSAGRTFARELDAGDRPLTAVVHATSARAGLSLSARAGRVRTALLVGGGFDWVRAEPRAAVGSATPAAPTTDRRLAGRGALAVSVDVWGPLGVFGSVELERVNVITFRLDGRDAQSSHAWQPAASLGFALRL